MEKINFRSSINKETWIAKQLFSLPGKETILDIQSQHQPYKKYCGHLKYISHDIQRYNQDKQLGPNQVQTHTFICPTENLASFQKYRVDNILCTDVLHKLPFPYIIFSLCQKILKNRGYLILTFPCSGTLEDDQYYSGLTYKWVEFMASKYKFKIIDASYNGNYFEVLSKQLSELSDIIKEYCDETYNINFGDTLNWLDNLSSRDKGSEKKLSCGLNILLQYYSK